MSSSKINIYEIAHSVSESGVIYLKIILVAKLFNPEQYDTQNMPLDKKVNLSPEQVNLSIEDG